MAEQLLVEEKHYALKKGLSKSLQRKHQVELRIREQLEELKKLEASMEKARKAQNEFVHDYV
jgi:hypothetical protein